jgi:hypothetical protein
VDWKRTSQIPPSGGIIMKPLRTSRLSLHGDRLSVCDRLAYINRNTQAHQAYRQQQARQPNYWKTTAQQQEADAKKKCR